MRLLCALLLGLCLMGCAAPRSYMGYRVVDFPFEIAGVGTVGLPVTDGGPIPAESDRFKVEVAGFVVGQSKRDPKQGEVTWRFVVSAKKEVELTNVTVEEVTPSKEARLIIKDEAPGKIGNPKDVLWRASTPPASASPADSPWLYSDKASIYVFRFTINERGQAPVVLYQPAWFAVAAKQAMLKAIER